ncbi:expressed unknown protein [Seminavis robusta]|uniref:Uncharacterized protein n=1 Tax=Seminavis robusta TaxID=568900 RepID=A0A9N8H3V0_9STRA|nr:expressed unknown protein [Seminavis robusta]|eukprot:Sro69_g038710.1 n/a (226) ;mRNA; f:123220-123897
MNPSTNESIESTAAQLPEAVDSIVMDESMKRCRASNESCDGSDTPQKRHIKDGSATPPMTLIGLVQARRSPPGNDLSAATTSLSLDSATFRRFSRRSSHVSDMTVAKSRASKLLNLAYQQEGATSEEAQALGYGASEEPRPTKRRRYQRRNSFVVAETSRSSGQQSGFSWRAMDFLYGRSQPVAVAQPSAASMASDEALRELGMSPSLLPRGSPPTVASVDQVAS